MDRFAKNFIIASVVYLALAALMGVAMLKWPAMVTHSFIHSHLMLLGWVSMMIYGVGYHILPRFVGQMIKNKKLPEAHFWLGNISLIGMLATYPAAHSGGADAETWRWVTTIFALIHALSIFIFFYVMITIMPSKEPEPPKRA